MSELSFDKALKKIEYTFRWTGMNLESNRKPRSENLKYKCVYLFNFVCLNTDVACAIAWFINGIIQGATFSTLTYSAPCLAYTMLTNTKYIGMLIYEEQVNKIISMLRKLEIVHRKHEMNLEKEEMIKKEVNFLYFVLKAMSFFNWTLLIAFPMMPLCLMALEYYNTERIIELKLPFYVLCPFDAYDIKYYPWCYLKLVWSTVVVVFVIGGVDYLFYVCVAFVCIQFKLLQYDMSNFISGDKTTYKVYPDVGLRRRFVELVKWHQELIDAAKILEVMYTKANLINFMLSSFLICLCGFNILIIDDKPFIVSFGSFLFTCLLQIFAICYFGDMLMRSSTEVGDAIFASKWYLTNASVGKEVNIIQLRSQKPCKITAYGFADVNLSSFTKILSTSWSYFALLRTIYTPARA